MLLYGYCMAIATISFGMLSYAIVAGVLGSCLVGVFDRGDPAVLGSLGELRR